MLITNSDLINWARNHHNRNRCSVGFTCGTFDLLHAGHVDYLKRAAALCDKLVIAVNSCSSVLRYKGHAPVNSLIDRMTVVDGLRRVCFVTPLFQERPEELLTAIKPDYYIKGGDYSVLRSARVVEAYGGEVVIIPVVHRISTSMITLRIKTRPLTNAPRM